MRLYGDKKTATIYDVVVLPSDDMSVFATIELRRYLEYARLALNCDELMIQLQTLLNRYNLEKEDIEMFNDDKEDVINE